VHTTPKEYRATTTILVTRAGVPENVVRSSVTLHIEERMRTLELQLFSRSYLEQIARTFEMVPANASEARIDATCRKLRRQIIPELDRQNYSWFRISVEDVDPKRAAGIANQLADLFIEQNTRTRASQTTGTLEATESWEQKYRLELEKRDEEISTFKTQNLYELPDQQPANEQLLYNARNNVASLTTAIQSANDRLIRLRSQRDGERAIPVAPGLPDSAAGGEAGHLAMLHRSRWARGATRGTRCEGKQAQIAELVRTSPTAVVAGTQKEPSVAAPHDAISLHIAAVESEIGALSAIARETATVFASARIRNAQGSTEDPRAEPRLDQAKRARPRGCPE
jgi:hypothetical protein